MTPTEGQKRLKKLLGPKCGYQFNSHALTGDELRAAEDATKAAMSARTACAEARKARHRAVLAADAEYQRLVAEERAADTEVSQALGKSLPRRLKAGVNLGWAFEIRAEGDNWAEVIRILESK